MSWKLRVSEQKKRVFNVIVEFLAEESLKNATNESSLPSDQAI